MLTLLRRCFSKFILLCCVDWKSKMATRMACMGIFFFF